jgi:hypothetical protein
MHMSENAKYPQRGHKPAANHPWKKALVKREIVEFARENSTNAYVNNFKKGGGKDPWNK